MAGVKTVQYMSDEEGRNQVSYGQSLTSDRLTTVADSQENHTMPQRGWMMPCQSGQDFETRGAEVGG